MNSYLRFFLYRTLQTLVLLFIIITFLFFFFRLMGGSFTDIMIQRGANPDSVAELESKWGLNKPLYIQYYYYLMNMITGDVGFSLQYREPVWEVVKMKIFNSFILVAPGITISYIIGSYIGGRLGNARGSKKERYGLLPIIFLGAFPAFFTSIFLIVIFSGFLNWFPTSGMFGKGNEYVGTTYEWWRPYLTMDFALHYTLPFVAIMMRYLYLPSLIMRTSVVEVVDQDFFFYHRMTGLPKNLRLRHLIKNASLPVITLYPISMTRAIGGLVVIEMVFNWPGIGFLLIESVLARDLPVVQFVFLLVAAFIIISNFAIDIIYGLIDPRVSINN